MNSAFLLPVFSLLLLVSPPGKIEQQTVFVIGASTVRYDNIIPGEANDNHPQYFTRQGWGSALHRYLYFPANLSNQARRGATAANYQIENTAKGPAYWAATRQLIESTERSEGGFLLIQFGGNDNIQGVDEAVFKENLRFYRDAALDLNLTPVLITPVESRTTGVSGTRGSFPLYVRQVAAEDSRAILLDLHARSLAYYLQSSTVNLGYRFGNVPYITPFGGHFSRIDNTHFEPRGAQLVAGWVRDLACENENQSLCRIFDPGVNVVAKSVYSHAEYMDDPNQPDINGWYVADSLGNIDLPETANLIQQADDAVLGSRVTLFTHPDTLFIVHGDRHNNAPHSWENTEQKNISWRARFVPNDFRIYIEVTTQDGHRHFTYKPLDFDEGPGQNFPEYLRYGLGVNAADGQWHDFQRDLQADLHQFEPDNEVIQVDGFRIKGTGGIDDLQMY